MLRTSLFRRIMLAGALLALGGAAPLAAKDPSTAARFLESARERYARAVTVHGTFEGITRQLGNERPIRGSIDCRTPDAWRLKILSRAAPHMGTVYVQQDRRLKRWIVGAGEPEAQETLALDEPTAIPLIPPFNTIDLESAKVRDVSNPKGGPSVYDVEAALSRPIDSFTATRLGIEEGTWRILSLELRSEKGEDVISIRFDDMRFDVELAEGVFDPPTQRD